MDHKTTYDYAQNNSRLLNLELMLVYEYQWIVCGYIMLPFGIFVAFLNSLLLYIFWKRNMKNTTHILVAAMTISETLNILLPGIGFTYFIAVLKLRKYIPFEYCSFFMYIVDYIPTIFRFHSIFLMVTLATQRFICVSYPLRITGLLTRNRTLTLIVVLLFFSILSRLFDLACLYQKKVTITVLPENVAMDTCIMTARGWVGDQLNTLFLVHNIVWNIPVHILPLIWVIFVGVKLIITIRKANKWRKEFLSDTHIAKGRLQEQKLTKLTMWIIFAFLFVQIPVSIVESILSYVVSFSGLNSHTKTLSASRTIVMCVLYLTLPSTFVIYILCFNDCFKYIKSIFGCINKKQENNSNTDLSHINFDTVIENGST